MPEYMTLWLAVRECQVKVSVPLQRSGQGSEALRLQYSAGDVEMHEFPQVLNKIITF